MPSVDVVVETEVSRSPRARQLEGMFDVPPSEKTRLQWRIDAPIESKPWSITSVVDRQVAQIGSHAVQKYVRRNGLKFVAVACHYDIEEWLQPDWVIEPATESFRWRSVQPRPRLSIEISRVPHAAWRMFAPFHYMTAELHPAAQCFGLWCEGRLAAFAGVIPRPISSGAKKGTSIPGVSRLVTLPDFQGLGLAFVLVDHLGAAYRSARNVGLRTYPAHPALIRSFDHNQAWSLVKRPGVFAAKGMAGRLGGRPCAVFEYRGAAHPDRTEAARLIAGKV